MTTNIYNADIKGICSVKFHIVDGCLERVMVPGTSNINEHHDVPCTWHQIDEWIASYLQGKLKKFPYPIRPSGGEFQKKVWMALLKIPFGEVKTYGEIAVEISSPNAARAVGTACGKNPIPLIIPCHRVVAAKGLGGFSLGLPLKKRLLLHEGAIKP